jgi:hypothetical protein
MTTTQSKQVKRHGNWHSTSMLRFCTRASITSRSPTIEPTFLSENESKERHISANMFMIKIFLQLKMRQLF